MKRQVETRSTVSCEKAVEQLKADTSIAVWVSTDDGVAYVRAESGGMFGVNAPLMVVQGRAFIRVGEDEAIELIRNANLARIVDVDDTPFAEDTDE